MYLWHYLLLWSGISWPVILLGTIAIAGVSYRCLERPFLRLKERSFGQPRIDVAIQLREPIDRRVVTTA
jgi:peptidoglycan/LPS O-acetylase OafA/YrhL